MRVEAVPGKGQTARPCITALPEQAAAFPPALLKVYLHHPVSFYNMVCKPVLVPALTQSPVGTEIGD